MDLYGMETVAKSMFFGFKVFLSLSLLAASIWWFNIRSVILELAFEF
jgi:hypothetical protein